MEITSLNNDKVKFWEKLKQKKYRDGEHLFLVEDYHLLDIALKLGYVKEIITTNHEDIYEVPTYYVTPQIMKKLSNQVTSAKVIAVCHELEEKKVEGNIIVLDNLQDPGNLGTIIRSAVAFNFENIILSETCVDIYNPKVIRASEGMIFYVNFKRCNIIDFLNNLPKNYTKITTNVKKAESIKDVKKENVALVIGNEGKGVSREVADICDVSVKIPMNPNCESLNAGVGASILMYEVNNG